MKLMKTILRKIIAIIVAGWGVVDWALSTRGIDVYNYPSPTFPITSRILNAIGDFMPDWLIFLSPAITFWIAALIWVGFPWKVFFKHLLTGYYLKAMLSKLREMFSK